MAKLSGTCFVTVDGQSLSLQGALAAPINSVVRETVLGSAGVAGFRETPVTPHISGDFFIDGNFPLQMLQQGENMTIVAEFANGRVYVLSGAYLTEEQEYNADDGTVTLRFDGMHGDWQ